VNKKTYEKLIAKLENYLDTDGVDPSVSPTLGSGGGSNIAPDPLFITGDMDVESLSENDLHLTHTLLHKFYETGGGRNLSRKTIERLHVKVANKIENHVSYDKLDIKNETNKRSVE